jgi:hypothetical protein
MMKGLCSGLLVVLAVTVGTATVLAVASSANYQMASANTQVLGENVQTIGDKCVNVRGACKTSCLETELEVGRGNAKFCAANLKCCIIAPAAPAGAAATVVPAVSPDDYIECSELKTAKLNFEKVFAKIERLCGNSSSVNLPAVCKAQGLGNCIRCNKLRSIHSRIKGVISALEKICGQ